MIKYQLFILLRRLTRIPYRWYVLRKWQRQVRPRLLGLVFDTDPNVFHPTCFQSTKLLAEAVLCIPLQGVRLLDMGTGSGAVGILAAAAGARVVACDCNPYAVALADLNAKNNGVEVDVRESDLFKDLAGEYFNLICFNVPFYPRPITTPLEAAFNAGENFQTVRRFAEQAMQYLLPDGQVLVIFSEDSGYDTMMNIFQEQGYTVVRAERRMRVFEQFYLVWLKQ